MIDIRLIDALEGLKTLESNSVDLVLTSPPYADISLLNYGSVEKINSKNYIDWFLTIMKEINRVLKPSGSFILNINDFCKGGYKDKYIYHLISKSDESGLKLYDTYFWVKKAVMPNGSPKRFRNTTEFIFHFNKDYKQMKFYMDRVLQEPTETTKNRYNYSVAYPDSVVDGERTYRPKTRVIHALKFEDGKRVEVYVEKEVSYMVRPTNVFNFKTGSGSRENEIKHPAPFHEELPLFFIKVLTDENDLVVDPFSGIGTTGVSCVKTGRDYIDFDLNENYIEYSKKRINKYEII